MADDQRKTGLVGEPLEFALPQPAAGAVAAAAIGGDDQAVGGAVARFADIVPPTADRVDGEGGRVVIDPDAHPSAIGADVVDPVRDCLAQFRDQEIVGPHRFGLAPRAPGSTRILEVADQFLLLGVDRDRRLPSASAASTVWLRYSNWALRSGWCDPSRVLRFTWRRS